MFLVILGILFFCFPLAVYLLILTSINRRPSPVMVPGSWDFLGLLLASSGFLLFGGPCALTGFNENWRTYWLYSLTARQLRMQPEHWWFFWYFVWALYFVAIIVGSGVVLWRRRRMTSIYNIEPGVFQLSLALACKRLRLGWRQMGKRLLIELPAVELAENPAPVETPFLLEHLDAGGSFVRNSAAEESLRPDTADPFSTNRTQVVELVVDASPAMSHVSLEWRGEPGLPRQVIEAELAKILATVRTHHNAMPKWLLVASGFLLAMVSLALMFVIAFLIVISTNRW